MKVSEEVKFLMMYYESFLNKYYSVKPSVEIKADFIVEAKKLVRDSTISERTFTLIKYIYELEEMPTNKTIYVKTPANSISNGRC